jgi:PhnB protein
MPINAANPYIILNGHADRAIAFYASAMGAETKALLRFGDNNPGCEAAIKDNVMHCELKVGSGTFMLSDGPGKGELLPKGAVHVALDIDNKEHGKKIFDALAVGGVVETPLFDAPWGGMFGALIDQFNVQWMFNVKP